MNSSWHSHASYQLPTACSAEKQSPLDPLLCVSLRGAYEMKYLTHVAYFVLLKDQLNPSIRLSRPFTSMNTYPKPVLKSSFELVNCYGKKKLWAPGPLVVRSSSRRETDQSQGDQRIACGRLIMLVAGFTLCFVSFNRTWYI